MQKTRYALKVVIYVSAENIKGEKGLPEISLACHLSVILLCCYKIFVDAPRKIKTLIPLRA
tara:strand:+ start:1176 stop:1358 length:183 start_codon:yes stop_codon:yes gene_type:complete